MLVSNSHLDSATLYHTFHNPSLSSIYCFPMTIYLPISNYDCLFTFLPGAMVVL